MAEAFRALIAAGILALAVAASPGGAVTLGARAPTWAELSPADKEILAPLAGEWDSFDAGRRQKWLGISKRYPKLAPAEQERLRHQMGAWAQLTPDQRKQAREQYKSMRQMPPDKRRQVEKKWQEYQQLPPEQRRELGARGASSAPPQPASKQ